MSTHRNCNVCGTGDIILRPLIVDDFVSVHILTYNLVTEEAQDPSIPLAPNHQDYAPNHRKQRRGKFKRPGR